MGRLDDILSTAGLAAGAATDTAGQVLDSAGQHDFDSLCAAFAMCRPHLEISVDLLALGNLQVVSFLHGNQSVFARTSDDNADVFVGSATKNPDATAQKLLAFNRSPGSPRPR
jgi:hypothetical protein